MNKLHILPAFGLLLCVCACASASAGDRSAYWEQRVSLFDKLPVDSTDVVFLGNSITDGGEWQELFQLENVKNRGISSDVIDGVRDRLEQVTSGHPAKIFLLIGINDVSHHLGVNAIARKYESLVREIRKQTPTTKLYIQSILPIDNGFKRYKNLIGEEKTVTALNERLKTIAAENGAEYVDLWPIFADPATGKLKRSMTNDGLHLTGEGYRRWVEFIRPIVLSDLEIIPLTKENAQ